MTYNPDDTSARPSGSNADEWALFLEEHATAHGFCAVQIAEAIEQAEREAVERAVARMGWPEIRAFQAELDKGQGITEDAGGYFMRAIRRLFGLPEQKDAVFTYRDAIKAMIHEGPK